MNVETSFVVPTFTTAGLRLNINGCAAALASALELEDVLIGNGHIYLIGAEVVSPAKISAIIGADVDEVRVRQIGRACCAAR